MNRPNLAQPDRNALLQLISQKLKKIKNSQKYEEVYTILSCKLSNFQSVLLNVTIRKSIQTDKAYAFFGKI